MQKFRFLGIILNQACDKDPNTTYIPLFTLLVQNKYLLAVVGLGDLAANGTDESFPAWTLKRRHLNKQGPEGSMRVRHAQTWKHIPAKETASAKALCSLTHSLAQDVQKVEGRPVRLGQGD